jgi:hypothetical protein
MLSRFHFEIIKEEELSSFFSSKYKPSFDFANCEEVFDNTIELAFNQEGVSATNIIHMCYDNLEERYCGLINLTTNHEIDDLTCLAIDFLYIEPEYRKITLEHINCKLSEYILQDYIIGEIGAYVKKTIGVNYLILAPITDKVRKVYEDMGFLSIPDSKQSEFEDWMIFHL